MNKILLVLITIIISGCGSNSTESIVEPASFAPVTVTPTVPEPPTQIVVDVSAEEEPEAPVEIESPTPVVPEPEPVTSPPVVLEPTVIVEVPEPVIEDNGLIYDFEDDTTVIINYLEYVARKALSEINQAYYSNSLSTIDADCISDSQHDTFPTAQTDMNCEVPRDTIRGDLSTLVAVRDLLCISVLESEFDARACEIDSTEQSINGEYEITMVKDGSNTIFYIIDIEADLGDDMCIVSVNEGTSTCPFILYDMADIIKTFGYIEI